MPYHICDSMLSHMWYGIMKCTRRGMQIRQGCRHRKTCHKQGGSPQTKPYGLETLKPIPCTLNPKPLCGTHALKPIPCTLNPKPLCDMHAPTGPQDIIS